jgi:hypothetical protein
MISLSNEIIIVIFALIGVLTILLSLLAYFAIRSMLLERMVEKYIEKISVLFKLPFNNKLRKLEALKEKHPRYEEDYQEIKVLYANFTDIKVETFMNKVEKTKRELKGLHIRYPREKLDEVNKLFANLINEGLRIIKQLDELTYPEQMQMQIFKNVQDSFRFFKNSYAKNKGYLKHFTKTIDA